MSCRFLMRDAAATALPVWPFALGWCAAALSCRAAGLGLTAISLLWLPSFGQTGLALRQNAVA